MCVCVCVAWSLTRMPVSSATMCSRWVSMGEAIGDTHPLDTLLASDNSSKLDSTQKNTLQLEHTRNYTNNNNSYIQILKNCVYIVDVKHTE